MNRRLAQWLLRAYPRPWRDRYGREFVELLEHGAGGAGVLVNVLLAALRERCVPTLRTRRARPVQGSILTLCKHPSAHLPVALSLAALAVVLVHVAMVGTAPQADEGAAAHLWQWLMACQIPLIAWFALRWLRRERVQALTVLAAQISMMLAAVAPVYFLHL